MSNKQFLDAYKAYETAIYTNIKEDNPVQNYEERSPDMNKLKICRQMRNFMSHNEDSFLKASDEQTDLLKKHAFLVNSIHGTAKDRMMSIARSPVISDTDTLIDALMKINKLKDTDYFVVLSDGKYKGVATYRDILLYISGKPVLSSKIGKMPVKSEPMETVSFDCPVSKLKDQHYLVEKNDKIIGFI